jgi:hypothetical protein
MDLAQRAPRISRERLGQPMEVRAGIDGSRVRHHGEVLGLRAGTGSALAVLPEQMAAPPWAGPRSPQQLKRRRLRAVRVPVAELRLELEDVVGEPSEVAAETSAGTVMCQPSSSLAFANLICASEEQERS